MHRDLKYEDSQLYPGKTGCKTPVICNFLVATFLKSEKETVKLVLLIYAYKY